MKRYYRFTLAAALLIAALQVLALGRGSAAMAASVASCEVRLLVELTPEVPNPRDAGFVSSLLSKHPGYRLTVQPQDSGSGDLIVLDLTGPGPVAHCREVVNSIRKDARVVSLEAQRDAATTASPASTVQPGGAQAMNTVQRIGTVQAGPDGDWVLTPSSGVSYAQQAQVRYECDIKAVDQTGFDPTEADGGVPSEEITQKRSDYLRAEAACFQGQGYILR